MRFFFRNARAIAPVAGLMCLCLAAGCGKRSVSAHIPLVMGTEAAVTLPRRNAARLAKAADIVMAEFDDIERRMSIYRSESELSAVNRKAGNAPVPVSPVTFDTLALALDIARWSRGAFDPTVAPLVRLWGFGGARIPESTPSRDQLAAAAGLVGYEGVRLDAQRRTVRFDREGMALDLGGVAKGKAADRAAAALRAAGFDAFLINLGGDIRCAGRPARRSAWRVGVRHPFDGAKMLGTVSMRSDLMAVATSGNYERYVLIDGQRHAHLIDPRNGYPVRGMASVTVLAPTAGEADALATALFVEGLEGTRTLIAMGNAVFEAMLVPEGGDLEIWVTPGFEELFEPLPEFGGAIRRLVSAPAPSGRGHVDGTEPPG